LKLQSETKSQKVIEIKKTDKSKVTPSDIKKKSTIVQQQQITNGKQSISKSEICSESQESARPVSKQDQLQFKQPEEPKTIHKNSSK
tara:strand:+ start:192 stop:452 length:261 start_codon:yes stop_codon:yes gene_type:complete